MAVSKRALIPILGRALGYVAGLVRTDQLRKAKASIRNLERIIQARKGFITLDGLNTTLE